MANIDELDETAQRLKVSWRKANNYYRSFGTQFLEVKAAFERGEYPGWTFSSWLIKKAGMFEEQILMELKVFARRLAEDDREKLREETERIERDRRAAKAREEAEKRAAIAERQAIAAHAKREKEAAHAEAARAKAVKQADKQTKRNEAREAEKKAAQRLAARRRYQERKLAAAVAAAAGAGVAAVASEGETLDQLAMRIILGKGKAERGRGAWVEGTMEAAVALADAKDRFPHTPAFGRWLTDKGIDYNDHDRAALVNMGRVPEQAEEILKISSRTSYKHIWREEIMPRVVQMDNSTTFEEFDESADPLIDNVVLLRG